MFYTHQYTPSYNNIKHPQPQPTKLPSFNELLTSIPLPGDFYHKSSSCSSSSSMSVPAPVATPVTQHSQPPPQQTPIQIVQPQPYYATPNSNSMSHYQPARVHSIPLHFQQPQPHPVAHPHPQSFAPTSLHQSGYITYQKHIIHSSVSPKTVLDNAIEIPTPPPSTDSLSHPNQNNNNNLRSYTLAASGDVNGSSSNAGTPRPSSSLSSVHEPSSSSNCATPKNIKRKHICKTCTRSFTTSGHLARHNRIHTGERKHVCPWPTCDARFARQDNCMQHHKTHTNGKNKRSKLNFKNSHLLSKTVV